MKNTQVKSATNWRQRFFRIQISRKLRTKSSSFSLFDFSPIHNNKKREHKAWWSIGWGVFVVQKQRVFKRQFLRRSTHTFVFFVDPCILCPTMYKLIFIVSLLTQWWWGAFPSTVGLLIGFCLIFWRIYVLLLWCAVGRIFTRWFSQLCIIILACFKSKFRSAAYSPLASVLLGEWVAWSGNVQNV